MKAAKNLWQKLKALAVSDQREHLRRGQLGNSGGALAENVNYAVKSSYLLTRIGTPPMSQAR